MTDMPGIIHGSEHVSFKVRTETQGVGSTDIGSKMVVEDGRTYRWSKVGVGPTVVSHLWQAELINIAVQGDQAIDTLTASNNVFTLTGIGSTTDDFAADVLKDGYVFIDSVANLNPAWRIRSNTAIANGDTTGTITIGTKIVDDIAVGETVSYCKNPWRDIIQQPGGPTAIIAGVTVSVIADEGFGWVQTGGPARILIIGTVLEADPIAAAGTAGGVMPIASQETEAAIGYVMADDVTTEYGIFCLNFDC